jgi:5-methyltetrahydrofolate--homocysteine methyltransferase
MLYKEDWTECSRNFAAWWEGRQPGRPVVAFVAPRDEPLPAPPAPPPATTPEEHHMDVDRCIAGFEDMASKLRFFGEAFPNINYNYGPGSLALYLGGEPGISWNTVWFEPLPGMLSDPESMPLPVFDPDNPWWKRHYEGIAKTAEAAKGKYLATVPDLVENLDILAALRDPQHILFDLYDRPQWVHQWLDRIESLYFDYFDPMYELVKDDSGGNAFTAFQVWAPGKMAKVQCDFSAMIGADMFAEFVVPTLEKQCDKLDYAVFHLDGKECRQHVQHLVKIGSLDAIQWTPGAGEPGLGDPCWYDLYHEIRDGGKSLLLVAGQLSEPEAKAVAKEIGTEGVYFRLANQPSEAAGEDLMKRVQDW